MLQQGYVSTTSTTVPVEPNEQEMFTLFRKMVHSMGRGSKNKPHRKVSHQLTFHLPFSNTNIVPIIHSVINSMEKRQTPTQIMNPSNKRSRIRAANGFEIPLLQIGSSLYNRGVNILNDIVLNDIELNILTLVLKFIPNPISLSHNNDIITACITDYCRRIRLKRLFAYNNAPPTRGNDVITPSIATALHNKLQARGQIKPSSFEPPKIRLTFRALHK